MQAVGLDAQAKAERIAGEADTAPVGARGAGDLLPVGRGEPAWVREEGLDLLLLEA